MNKVDGTMVFVRTRSGSQPILKILTSFLSIFRSTPIDFSHLHMLHHMEEVYGWFMNLGVTTPPLSAIFLLQFAECVTSLRDIIFE